MHSFWLVLIVPLLGSTAFLSRHQSVVAKLQDSLVRRIWTITLCLTTTVGLGILFIDLAIWSRSAPSSDIYHSAMRSLYWLLTATDVPIVQTWLGTLAGWLISRRSIS